MIAHKDNTTHSKWKEVVNMVAGVDDISKKYRQAKFNAAFNKAYSGEKKGNFTATDKQMRFVTRVGLPDLDDNTKTVCKLASEF